jgi:3-deoxy-7-phosphoheptulonate synthase
MIEIHPHPSEALSDGYQSLKPERFRDLMVRVRRMADLLDRSVAAEVPQ